MNETERDLETVIQKIRKLFKLAESPVLAEAEEATRKAHTLLLKYHLDIQSIGTEINNVYTEEETITRKRFYNWQVFLHVAVARLNLCSTLNSKSWDGGKTMSFFGRPCNTITARHTFEYLLEVVERITWEETDGYSKGERLHFKTGLVLGIRETVEEILRQDAEHSDCRDLILSEEHNIKKALQDQGVKTGKARTYQYDEATAAGLSRGKEIPLNRQIEGKAVQPSLNFA